MQCVDSAFDSTLTHPETPVVLGIVAGRTELGYGWIEPGQQISNGAKLPAFQISGFWEKPALHLARELYRRACLLSTFVIVGPVSSLISTIASALPRMYASLNLAQSALGNALEEVMIRATYARISRADFSQSVLARQLHKFAVMPIAGIGWSDLGEPERIIALRSREIEVATRTTAIRSPIPVNAVSRLRLARRRARSRWA
jgi:mannose-1-phosphate guanylyltransferase